MLTLVCKRVYMYRVVHTPEAAFGRCWDSLLWCCYCCLVCASWLRVRFPETTCGAQILSVIKNPKWPWISLTQCTCSLCVHHKGFEYGALYKSDNNLYYRCCVYLWYSSVYPILWKREYLEEKPRLVVCVWYCTGSDLCFVTPPFMATSMVDIF